MPGLSKGNHQKSKSNKRNQQRQEQQRQSAAAPAPAPAPAVEPEPKPEPRPVERQTTPIPPTPVVTQVVEQPAPPKKHEDVEEPPPITEKKIETRIEKPNETEKPREERYENSRSEPVNKEEEIISPAKEDIAEKEKIEVTPEIRKKDDRLEEEKQKEDLLVAAKNEENKKLSATNSQPPTLEPENNNIDSKMTNNNNVTVVVEVTEPPPVIEPPKPVLRHSYKDDQWSPINPDGKKRYERDFIMQLMHDPQSKKRPENLPQLDLLKDSRVREISRGGGPMASSRHGGDILMPNFSKSSSLRGQIMPNKRLSQSKMRPKQPMPIQLSLSLNDEVKLRECEKPWKPSRVGDASNRTEDDKKTDALYKKVRSVLNKLTPQKFSTLIQQIRELNIDTESRLQGVIDLVFEKAVEEPGFSVTYADMCMQISQITVPANVDPDNPQAEPKFVAFRTMLLHRCQDQFEQNSKDEKTRAAKVEAINDEPDPEKKKALQLKLDDDDRRARIKDVGNIRFVGELFKKRMLRAHVVYSCIDTLLRHNDEDSFECLCKLLSTIGKLLDETTQQARHAQQQEKKPNAEAVPSLDKYFAQLHEIASKNRDKKNISSRVKFMIQDLLDLRLRYWIPRRDEANPKTMDQIAKEAEREMHETNILNANPIDKRGPKPDQRNYSGKRGSESRDGWITAGKITTNKSNKLVVDSVKLRFNQNELESYTFGNREQFRWNQSNSGSKSEQRSKEVGGMGLTQNKFALLDDKPPSRTSSLKGNAPPDKPVTAYKSAAQGANQMHDITIKQETVKQTNRDSAPVSRAESLEPPSTPAPRPPLEDNQRVTEALLDEFISVGDFEEARLCLDDKFGEADKDEMVLNVFLHCLEKSGLVRRNASRLLAHFLNTNGISKQHFLNGVSSFLENTDDLVIDIPKVWEYLAELTVDVVMGCLNLEPLIKTFDSSAPGPLRCIGALLRLIHTDRPDSPILVDAPRVLISFLGGPKPFEAFVKDHKVEFLVKQDAVAPRQPDENWIAEELQRLMRANATFDTITEWVKLNVNSSDPVFIRALTTAVFQVSLVKAKKLDKDIFNKYPQLLHRFIDNVEDRELHCLSAVQAVVIAIEHPKGVLLDMCTELYDQCIITGDSFKKWRDSGTDCSEGKGVCTYSLTSFFAMLDEGDDDETS